MATVSEQLTEADILAQVIAPEEATLPEASARAILDLRFNADATRCMTELAERNGRGELSAKDHDLLERYQRVGNFLNLFHAKARLSLLNRSAGE